ncbi:MAG: hypothetical protein E7201_02240 [Selenomonas ruminantium]|uniref:Uncharacterized protein n=1 Tax=Selenomonas ruminantium TaxID=971 RepID=A0A927ZWW1_SELRU|nr:hypothetical protein [Selenomonas ruminantium]
MKGRNSWLNYYIPLRWTFATRYINIINIISFFIIDAFPSFYVVAMFSNGDAVRLLHWFIAFVTMFCFYECGYIFNEAICVRFEEKPTIRIPEPFFSNILHHIENLITIRLVLGTIGSWFLLTVYPQNSYVYISFILLLFIVYTIHNFYRGIINIITMPLEVFLKYMIPISVFVESDQLWQAAVIVLLIIVLVRTIEYASKKRFIGWVRVTKNVDKFRIKYYIFVNVIIALLAYNYILPASACGLAMIFMLYRIASYIAMKRLNAVNEIINKGRKMHGTDK